MKRSEQTLADLLKEHKLTIAFAESMTCGLCTHKMGTVHGTSAIIAGSIICYSPEVKNSLLRVDKKLIEKYTSESQQVTDKLAKNLKKIIKADAHAAITGLAAEGGSETKSKPVGTVFISLLFKNQLYKSRLLFTGSPAAIKERACSEFFRFITKQIKSYVKE